MTRELRDDTETRQASQVQLFRPFVAPNSLNIADVPLNKQTNKHMEADGPRMHSFSTNVT